ncbi:Hypothetical protein SCLAV_2233 [Streptomyces clavuligerus]|uniref:Uncharacterized protein n=1 Tax=Streptomyces clavuligerus TaxID=1901 RepID=E2Q6I2_STRCL|nr:Hypothetical protein SCLAV_2233 [Streptomyces clavuligerus]
MSLALDAGSVLKRRTGLLCSGRSSGAGVGASGLDSSGPADPRDDVQARAVLRRSLPGTTLHPPTAGRRPTRCGEVFQVPLRTSEYAHTLYRTDSSFTDVRLAAWTWDVSHGGKRTQ